jgi:recombination protein RecA
MPKKEKIVEAAKPKNNYFTAPKEHYQFVSTGCTLLDCALGGGFVLGRVANIVGDKSTSKTGIATECLINFVRSYPDGQAAYRDAEAAFDNQYAQAMGLPVDKIDMGEKPLLTVEELHRDLEKFVEKQIKADAPGIYVLDSLDALSDEAELERDIGEASYGGNKAKKTSELFRRLTPRIEASKVLFLVVSQVRDNIGAMFGEKHKRSGGKALDFYATQIVWLAHLGQLTRTVSKVKRPYGIEVSANIKKNKISMPFRKAEFEFHFGYGIEDLVSNYNWLESVGRTPVWKEKLSAMSDDEYFALWQQSVKEVRETWVEIEAGFLPKRSKYA